MIFCPILRHLNYDINRERDTISLIMTSDNRHWCSGVLMDRYCGMNHYHQLAETTFSDHRTAIAIDIKTQSLYYRFLIVIKLYFYRGKYTSHIRRVFHHRR